MEYSLDWKGLELRARTLSSQIFEIGETIYCRVSPEYAVLVEA
jgi:iron(III) transport system ATP-binding protein